MAYTKIPILSRLIISVNKVSGSDGDDHCDGGAMCALGKQKRWYPGTAFFNLELANYFFQHVCLAHPQETVLCAGSVCEYVYGKKRNIQLWLSA